MSAYLDGLTTGPYRLEAILGVGGMATVYEAEHVGLRKRVALKVLHEPLALQRNHRARFLREGVAASRVRHPHIVEISDVREDGDLAYLVMELLDGEPLTSYLRRDTLLPATKAVDAILPIVAALGEAHRAGVTHRDIKPDNVFMARTAQGFLVPKLLDFGVSKVVSSSLARLTVETEVVGTPHYMSPEQARGEDGVGGASDQYSLAVVLYQCLTGRVPHEQCTTVGEILTEVARGIVVPPSLLRPELDIGLERVLLRALSLEPAERYPDIEAFGHALMPFASEAAQRSFAALVGLGEDEVAFASLSSLVPLGPASSSAAGPSVAEAHHRDDPATVPVRVRRGPEPHPNSTPSRPISGAPARRPAHARGLLLAGFLLLLAACTAYAYGAATHTPDRPPTVEPSRTAP